MTTQVPPTPPSVTLSVRWWNVTLMVIPQVSNFELYFHKVHIGSSSPFICTVGGKMPPLNPWITAKYCSVVVLLWGKSVFYTTTVSSGRLKKTFLLLINNAFRRTLGGGRTEIGVAEQNRLTRFGNSLLLPVDTVQYGQQSTRFFLPPHWFSVLALMSRSILVGTGKCILCGLYGGCSNSFSCESGKLSLSSIN